VAKKEKENSKRRDATVLWEEGLVLGGRLLVRCGLCAGWVWRFRRKLLL